MNSSTKIQIMKYEIAILLIKYNFTRTRAKQIKTSQALKSLQQCR